MRDLLEFSAHEGSWHEVLARGCHYPLKIRRDRRDSRATAIAQDTKSISLVWAMGSVGSLG